MALKKKKKESHMYVSRDISVPEGRLFITTWLNLIHIWLHLYVYPRQLYLTGQFSERKKKTLDILWEKIHTYIHAYKYHILCEKRWYSQDKTYNLNIYTNSFYSLFGPWRERESTTAFGHNSNDLPALVTLIHILPTVSTHSRRCWHCCRTPGTLQGLRWGLR